MYTYMYIYRRALNQLNQSKNRGSSYVSKQREHFQFKNEYKQCYVIWKYGTVCRVIRLIVYVYALGYETKNDLIRSFRFYPRLKFYSCLAPSYRFDFIDLFLQIKKIKCENFLMKFNKTISFFFILH